MNKMRRIKAPGLSRLDRVDADSTGSTISAPALNRDLSEDLDDSPGDTWTHLDRPMNIKWMR